MVFRGVLAFKIETSLDGNNWATAIQDSFQTMVFTGQQICPDIRNFLTYGVIEFRYLRFTALTYLGQGPGLQFLKPIDTGKVCQELLDLFTKMNLETSCIVSICCSPEIIQEVSHTLNRHQGASYGAVNMFSDNCAEVHAIPNFWHPNPGAFTGIAFTIDYCKIQFVYAFQLRNSNNAHFGDRSVPKIN